MTRDALDPKGLIREAYLIEGIAEPECRSIFLDWALGLPPGEDPASAITALLKRHGEAGHPMTRVLTEGLGAPARTGRRGGRMGRIGGEDATSGRPIRR